MKIKVIKDVYYVSEDLTLVGFVSKEELEASYVHVLVVGDIWEKVEGESQYSEDGFYFKCIVGTHKGTSSDGWWDYKYTVNNFEEI